MGTNRQPVRLPRGSQDPFGTAMRPVIGVDFQYTEADLVHHNVDPVELKGHFHYVVQNYMWANPETGEIHDANNFDIRATSELQAMAIARSALSNPKPNWRLVGGRYCEANE